MTSHREPPRPATLQRPTDAPEELALSRTGGGRTKWLVAVGAFVILGGVVYVGVTGQKPGPAQPSPAPLAAAASPSPLPTRTPFPADEVVSIRADPTAPILYQYLGAGLSLNGHGTLAILDPVEPDAYRGIYRIPFSQLTSPAHLELDAVTASVSHDDLDRLGDWTFPIVSVGRGAGPPIIALDSGAGPTDQTLTNPDFSRLVTNGYHLTATIQGESDAAIMTIDVTVNPDQFFPSESYAITAGTAVDQFTFGLEAFGPGGYDGAVPIPGDQLGKTIPITLTASSSGATVVWQPVGSWSIRVPAKPRNTNLDHFVTSTDGQPIGSGDPQILASGYHLAVGIANTNGKLNLIATLNVTPSTSPLPTSTR